MRIMRIMNICFRDIFHPLNWHMGTYKKHVSHSFRWTITYHGMSEIGGTPGVCTFLVSTRSSGKYTMEKTSVKTN